VHTRSIPLADGADRVRRPDHLERDEELQRDLDGELRAGDRSHVLDEPRSSRVMPYGVRTKVAVGCDGRLT
jgi:hypothetical protein